jgi:cation diffusion facilitator family transporter
VAWSLGVLGAAAVAQVIVFVATGSVALLADVVHNGGDALTAIPLAIAFSLGSRVAERRAGLLVVAAVFISAFVAGAESVARLVHPSTPGHLPFLATAGALGFVGNWLAGRIRTDAGERLHSAALIADGHHARADAYVSLGVIASAGFIAIGVPIADPLVGLAITTIILRITWQAWRTVHGDPAP